MKNAVLLVFMLFIGVLGAGSGVRLVAADVQNIVPGVDTLAPQMTKDYEGCGVYEFVAKEIRNNPDPPTAPPKDGDQVDKGIASITISGAPTSVNARLILVTDDNFPKDPSYKEFVFRIEPIDPSKKAVAYVWVRDWAGNVAGQEVTIDPAVPSSSDDQVAVESRVNTPINYTITLRNTTAEVQTVSAIELSGSARFAITSGGTVSTITMAPGSQRLVTVAYTPDLTSEAGDQATLHVRTPCGDKNIPLEGLGLLGKLSTEDWGAGQTDVNVKICKAGGFSVTNNGTADVTVTGFTSDNPNVTIVSTITAANPALLTPGSSVSVTELCYERATEGTDVANVTVQCNAEAGDVICQVTASAKAPTSVDPEVLARLQVRYDKSTGKVRFESNAAAVLYNIEGMVVGNSAERERSLDVRNCTSGNYFLVLSENPAVSIPLSIVK